VELSDGQTAYDPVTTLVTDSQGALFARRPSSREHELAEAAVIARTSVDPFQLPPALNVGWHRWQRGNDSFRVRSQPADVTLSKQTFIQDNRLLFEGVRALLASEADELYAATEHALWRFGDADLGLNQ